MKKTTKNTIFWKSTVSAARILGLFLLMVGLVFSIAAQDKRQVTPDDLVSLKQAYNLNVSPDGKWVVFVVGEPADPKKPEKSGDTNIWIVPSDGSTQPRLFASSPKDESQPRWSPDGRYLAFLSTRGEPVGEEKEPSSQIYLLRIDGGEAEQLTKVEGSVGTFRWSPDGRQIAFLVRDPLSAGDREKEKNRDDAVFVDHDYKFFRLWVIDLATKKSERLARQDLNVNDFTWSPDGSELALAISETPREDDLWMQKLIVVNRATGDIARTLSEAVSGNPQWSPDGKTIAMFEYTPQRIANRLALVSSAGGPSRVVLNDYNGTPWDFQWSPDSLSLIIESTEGSKMKLIRVELKTEAVTRLAEVYASGPGFHLAKDGSTIAFLQEPPDSPADIWSLRQEGALKRLTELNPQVQSLKLGEAKEISWRNKKDGQAIYGVLITPADFKPGQLYPTVVQIHGGPEWAWWTGWHGSWHEWGQLLASNGYVVLLPNPRGSDGQGWRFVEANRADWGGMDLQDVLSGVDWLIEQKIADPDRLGIGGWSYGGHLTSWTVTQTNRFKAAIVGAGVTNLFSFHGTTDITPNFLRSYFGDLPYRRRALYETHSAMAFVSQVKTPCLVLHGEKDLRVPVTQGWEFYTALRQLGVPVEMVTYPREPHGIGERAHQLDLLKRVLAWYDRYLKK
jgi:dipeptidyl aminopeptidase/acylaminoacyl peptidase